MYLFSTSLNMGHLDTPWRAGEEMDREVLESQFICCGTELSPDNTLTNLCCPTHLSNAKASIYIVSMVLQTYWKRLFGFETEKSKLALPAYLWMSLRHLRLLYYWFLIQKQASPGLLGCQQTGSSNRWHKPQCASYQYSAHITLTNDPLAKVISIPKPRFK